MPPEIFCRSFAIRTSRSADIIVERHDGVDGEARVVLDTAVDPAGQGPVFLGGLAGSARVAPMRAAWVINLRCWARRTPAAFIASRSRRR